MRILLDLCSSRAPTVFPRCTDKPIRSGVEMRKVPSVTASIVFSPLIGPSSEALSCKCRHKFSVILRCSTRATSCSCAGLAVMALAERTACWICWRRWCNMRRRRSSRSLGQPRPQTGYPDRRDVRRSGLHRRRANVLAAAGMNTPVVRTSGLRRRPRRSGLCAGFTIRHPPTGSVLGRAPGAAVRTGDLLPGAATCARS